MPAATCRCGPQAQPRRLAVVRARASASPRSASSPRRSSSRCSCSCSGSTWFSRLGGYPVSLFLEMDPLVGFATALSTHTVYRWLWRGVFVLVPTLLLGRVFCNWMCPYGTLHQFVGWLFNIRSNKDNIDKNRYRAAVPAQVHHPDDLPGDGGHRLAADRPARSDLPAGADVHDHGRAGHRPGVDQLGACSRSAAWTRAGSRGSPSPGAHEQRVFAGAWFVGRADLRPGRHEPGDPALLLPRALPAGRLPRLALALRAVADRPRSDQVHRLRPVPEALRGRRRPAGGAAQERVLRLLQLHRRLPRGRAVVQADAACRCKDRIVGADQGGHGDAVRPQGDLARSSRPRSARPAVPRRRWLFATLVGVLAFPFLRLSRAVNKRGFSEKASGRRARSPRPSSWSAASSATSASTSARPTCCSPRRSPKAGSRACGRR